MEKAEAISRLKPFEPSLRERGINALYLFGSTARDEAGDASDLDLRSEYDSSWAFSLFDQAGAMLELSDALGAGVDLVSRIGLRPRLKARIEGEMVQIFDGRLRRARRQEQERNHHDCWVLPGYIRS